MDFFERIDGIALICDEQGRLTQLIRNETPYLGQTGEPLTQFIRDPRTAEFLSALEQHGLLFDWELSVAPSLRMHFAGAVLGRERLIVGSFSYLNLLRLYDELTRIKQDEARIRLVQPQHNFPSELQLYHELAALNNELATMQRTLAKLNVEISEERDRFRVTLASISDAVVAVNERGQIVFANRQAAALTGWQLEEMQGQPLDMVLMLMSEDGRLIKAGAGLMQQGSLPPLPEPPWLAIKGRQQIPIEISCACIENDHGMGIGFVLVFRDIVERRRIEQERLELLRCEQEARQSAEDANARLRQEIIERKAIEEKLKAYSNRLQQSKAELQNFAYISSHDMQEPLRKVRAFGDRLQNKYSDQLGNEGKDYLTRMNSAVARMQRMLDDLLAYSRITTKAMPFELVNLREILREVVSDLEPALDLTSGQVQVDDLPIIEADPIQMRQLFHNLLNNALKYRQAEVAPQISITCTPGEDRTYQIRVQDNGIGFEEKYLDRIFTIFERLHGRTEYDGTGMGLAICKKIVDRHGGSITARSQPGEGSTFIVTLPMTQQVSSGK